MAAQARKCPRCGVRYDVPTGHGPVTGVVSTAESPPLDTRTESVEVDGVLVHQCQQRVDPITGKRAWRPARTVNPAR